MLAVMIVVQAILHRSECNQYNESLDRMLDTLDKMARSITQEKLPPHKEVIRLSDLCESLKMDLATLESSRNRMRVELINSYSKHQYNEMVEKRMRRSAG
jgi:hypothetical protein